MKSLRGRLLLAGALVLVGFVLFTGYALERAFQSSALRAQEEKLKGLAYAILGATEWSREAGLQVETQQLAEVEFLSPGGELTGYLLDDQRHVLWTSPSLTVTPVATFATPSTGEWLFTQLKESPQNTFRLAFGFSWANDDELSRQFTLVVGESATAYSSQLALYRQTLWGWLGLAVAVLLLVQFMVFSWGLRPLQRFVAELESIKHNDQQLVQGEYPQELTPLVLGLNSLLQHEKGQQKRYRNALGDLAHSLKTPLTVLRGFSQQMDVSAENRSSLDEQVGRLDRIVDYQLQRAAAVGSHLFLKAIKPRRVLDQLIPVVQKAYHDKSIDFSIDLSKDAVVKLDEGDLMEVLGNLLDNACKWCQRRVVVTGRVEAGHFSLRVEDDGPGFAEGLSDDLLKRGVRADSRHAGQGIGLAVVKDILAAYKGSFSFSKSSFGGALVEINISNI